MSPPFAWFSVRHILPRTSLPLFFFFEKLRHICFFPAIPHVVSFRLSPRLQSFLFRMHSPPSSQLYPSFTLSRCWPVFSQSFLAIRRCSAFPCASICFPHQFAPSPARMMTLFPQSQHCYKTTLEAISGDAPSGHLAPFLSFRLRKPAVHVTNPPGSQVKTSILHKSPRRPSHHLRPPSFLQNTPS